MSETLFTIQDSATSSLLTVGTFSPPPRLKGGLCSVLSMEVCLLLSQHWLLCPALPSGLGASFGQDCVPFSSLSRGYTKGANKRL